MSLAEGEETLKEKSTPILSYVVCLIDDYKSDITESGFRIVAQSVHEAFRSNDIDVRLFALRFRKHV
ncbi:hypothetical protein FMUAM8_42910 [Nocardia cyriacigeorgica]|nr:hypothetical protein FMUAM8_42910 [Nocardia cyriacigeorgica]